MATAEALFFPVRREPAFLRSFLLAAIMHAVLIGILFFGVRFQSHAPTTVEVELWEAAPPPPPPEVKPEPKPVPPPPPPKVEAPKPSPKPDIAEVQKPKPKPKAEAKPKPKAEAPKRDRELERRVQEQLAQEQKAVAQQDAERRERELKQLIAKREAAARASALDKWRSAINNKIRSRIPVPVAEAVQGNPEAVFSVSLLPTGEVIAGSIRMRKSSGNAAYDQALERAILSASPLPKPDDPSLFQRQLELTFRPKDKPGS